MDSIEFPDAVNGHVHLRDDDRLQDTVAFEVAQFAAGVIMPNLALPIAGTARSKHVTTLLEMLAYRDRIFSAIPQGADYTPLMTVSLTKDTTPEILREAVASEHCHGVKFYAGNTTNAEGVEDVTEFGWAFEILEKADKPLLIHGEAPVSVDVFDREGRFYDKAGRWIVENFPGLRVVCEHITTKDAVSFVIQTREGVFATITPHHLLSNRNDMLGEFIRPDLFCKPILKRKEDQAMLLSVATSGDEKFFGSHAKPLSF